MSNDAPVDMSEEQREAAHALFAKLANGCVSKLFPIEYKHTEECDRIARAFAERDRAAELRGAKREREVWLAKIDECFPPDVQAAIRARGK